MSESEKSIVVNYYDESGPQQLDLERMERYAKANGITKSKLVYVNGYPAIDVHEHSKCGKFQEWLNKLRSKTKDNKHLTSAGPDTPGGSES